MKVERVESALYPRHWSFNRHNAPQRQIALLTDGSGEADVDEVRLAIEAPALMFLGDLRPGRLRTDAGTTGYRASVSEGMFLAAIGDEAESLDLRRLAEHNFVLSLAGQREQAVRLERCLDGALRETRQPQEGFRMVLSALLRIILITALRVSAGEIVGHAGSGERSGILQRFRQLVELNFRNRWTVARYAAALGISADRLHAVCTDGLGKSPKALISERLANEAMLRLERSPLTVEQFAHSLGFGDPAHFSAFFRRMTGTTPGRYRSEMAKLRESGRAAPPPNFADWP